MTVKDTGVSDRLDSEFGDHLVASGMSPNTARVYVWRLKKLDAWLADGGESIDGLTPDQLERYVDEMSDSRTARVQLRAALKRLWDWTGRVEAPAASIVAIPPRVAPSHEWTQRDFEDFLLTVGLHEKTAQIYKRSAFYASQWATSHDTDLLRIGPVDLRAYVNEMDVGRSVLNQLRSALKYWWEWQGRDDPPIRAIRVPPKPKPRPKPLDMDDAAKLVKVSKGWYPQGTAVLVGFGLALRSAEIAALRWDRFDAELKWYTVTGKGDRTDTIPVHPTVVEALPHRRTGAQFVFPGSRGRPHVTSATVYNWVREVADEAGVANMHPHRLRHTTLTEVNDVTGDLRATQEFARHRRSESTEIYTRVNEQRLMKVVDALGFLD